MHVARVVVHAVVGLMLVLSARVIVVVFVVEFPWPDFLYSEVYSLHSPSVTVNCVGCYRIDHCNFCTKLLVRLMPHINRRFTDFSGFPAPSVLGPSSR